MAGDSDEAGQGHPLPASDEARTEALPEHLLREKGKGDDEEGAARPAGDAVAPDGESGPAGRERADDRPGRGTVRALVGLLRFRYDQPETRSWQRNPLAGGGKATGVPRPT